MNTFFASVVDPDPQDPKHFCRIRDAPDADLVGIRPDTGYRKRPGYQAVYPVHLYLISGC
jgi:hypothetical protein